MSFKRRGRKSLGHFSWSPFCVYCLGSQNQIFQTLNRWGKKSVPRSFGDVPLIHIVNRFALSRKRPPPPKEREHIEKEPPPPFRRRHFTGKTRSTSLNNDCKVVCVLEAFFVSLLRCESLYKVFWVFRQQLSRSISLGIATIGISYLSRCLRL